MSHDETVHKDTDTLHELLETKGNEDELIKFICSRKNTLRQAIKSSYIARYGEDVTKILSKKLSGNLEDCIIALMDSPIEYDAKQINKAIKGAGTDEDSLTEIIATRPPWRIEEIKQKYEEIFNKNLIEDVEDDTSSTYKHILVALLQAKRSENPYPNEDFCKKVAEELNNALTQEKGKDEDIFVKHFTMRSPAELSMISYYYERLYSKTLIKEVDNEFSSDAKLLLMTILHSLINPAQYFATRINKAVKGLGTNNKLLIRILVSRNEIDMPQIKSYYKKLYKTDLIEEIKGETNGDYQKLLVELVSH